MLLIPAPMSNAERQRKFRAAHPGYFRKYHARRKAAGKHAAQRARAAAAAAAAALAPTDTVPPPGPVDGSAAAAA